MARLVSPLVDRFRQFDQLEVCCSDSLIVDEYGFAGFRIHQPSGIRPGAGNLVGVPPEISQLRAFPTNDKQGWPTAKSLPALPRIRILLSQPQITERCAQPLAHNCAALEADFVDAVWRLLVTSVSHVIDQEDANAGNRQQCLACPFLD